MDSCMHEGVSFFNKNSKLGTVEEYEKLRNYTP
jgi:hypothetical protein